MPSASDPRQQSRQGPVSYTHLYYTYTPAETSEESCDE